MKYTPIGEIVTKQFVCGPQESDPIQLLQCEKCRVQSREDGTKLYWCSRSFTKYEFRRNKDV